VINQLKRRESAANFSWSVAAKKYKKKKKQKKTNMSLTAHPLVQFSSSKASKSSKSVPKVIYGDDDRVEISEAFLADIEMGRKGTTSAERRVARNARASVILVPRSSIAQAKDTGEYQLLRTQKFGTAYNLCPEERFTDQPLLGFCSGVAVAPNFVFTAGHCADANPKDIAFVFNFRQKADGTFPRRNIPAADVVFGKSVLHRTYTPTGSDYTIFVLDADNAPFAIGSESLDGIVSDITDAASGEVVERGFDTYVKTGRSVYVIGHPSGLPQKLGIGKVVGNGEVSSFTTDLDTYQGNSGSGVFDAVTDRLVGLLVRGETDFVSDTKRKCSVSNRCARALEDCSGEDVQRVLPLLLALGPETVPVASQDNDDDDADAADVADVADDDDDVADDDVAAPPAPEDENDDSVTEIDIDMPSTPVTVVVAEADDEDEAVAVEDTAVADTDEDREEEQQDDDDKVLTLTEEVIAIVEAAPRDTSPYSPPRRNSDEKRYFSLKVTQQQDGGWKPPQNAPGTASATHNTSGGKASVTHNTSGGKASTRGSHHHERKGWYSRVPSAEEEKTKKINEKSIWFWKPKGCNCTRKK
jgi:V8-like Glu-specific endopeptidase